MCWRTQRNIEFLLTSLVDFALLEIQQAGTSILDMVMLDISNADIHLGLRRRRVDLNRGPFDQFKPIRAPWRMWSAV